ncbi:hypothetical protein OHA79_09405 [Streptomyces sp. NBC_00841]|uniref:hypothetical protein n=1 Tax=Streptomyces sp. NBC_00841 TaxID=2975847 RepID=UPI002DDA4A8D|nr:hypothetical protein [Streptomyces sp. NBC_00841]WRZ98031.1 hypothetical protein OHA79_09405 [Streptomyces sp. NBC_00841]
MRIPALYVTTIAATIALVAVSGTSEAATGTVTSGSGWKLISPAQTTSLAPGTYTIQFDTTAARTRLTPYLKLSAARTQAQTPGVKFVVSTTIQRRVTTGCQAKRTIVVSLEYRPLGKKGFSQGGNCYNTLDHSLFSGYMRIDTEWFYSKWFSTSATTNTYRIRNSVTHEFGHAIGLGHPNKDLNHDGKISDYECKLNADKSRPLMCSPSGGMVTSAGAGNYTPLDIPGLKALVANYSLTLRS